MKFALDDIDRRYAITGYSAGRIRVGHAEHNRSLVVAAGQLIADWPPQSPEQLRPEHFDPILALEPEVLILGTGPRPAQPEPRLFRALLERQIGVEVMNTGAACRTYNILLAEERRVVAALLIP
jgi:uncharacterized protein